jgi:hypothetical protein
MDVLFLLVHCLTDWFSFDHLLVGSCFHGCWLACLICPVNWMGDLFLLGCYLGDLSLLDLYQLMTLMKVVHHVG